MTNNKLILSIISLFLFSFSLSAQNGNSVKLKLVDSLTKEPVAFATVYLSPDGTITDALYALSDENGVATIVKAKKRTYILKAEMMGYKPYTKSINVNQSEIDLGELKMKQDVAMLESAVISAVGNPIIVKKDTIEYNADSFKTTDNDMLEELLKKLPGIEVGTDGTITSNGKTINKITIDGKTFFLDDPQLAMKNIPAKIIKKVKVVEKKSEQAEFTGIDDGDEETVIDLSVQPGMMKGWFGNVSGGGGHDLPDKDATSPAYDARWQASSMVGRFTDKSQISFIGNGNNTNNRGFNDMMGETMNSMRGGTSRGGGGGGMWGNNTGITTSWLTGLNGNIKLLDQGALQLGGNYLYSGNNKLVTQESSRNTFVDDDQTLHTDAQSESLTKNQSHRAGVELDWKISDKTSILFRPQFNYGQGEFKDTSYSQSYNTVKSTGEQSNVNESSSLSSGLSDSWRTNGRLLFRQRIGSAKGRTLSLNVDYALSNSNMDGINISNTIDYSTNDNGDTTKVNQRYDQKQSAYSVSGNLTYTEPLGKNFFLQASYKYGWSQNNSEKLTYDRVTDLRDDTYSNRYKNTFINQDIQLNMMKQESKYNLQVGFSAQPSSTRSVRTIFGATEKDSVIAYNLWNFAPMARFDYRFSDNESLRINYRGRTTQPSITQLSPVPDNSNPLYVSLGNSHLNPSFNHRLRINYRKTDMTTFATYGLMANVSYVKDDIVNASWYNKSGVQYTAPVNSSEGSYSGMLMLMINSPIAKSKFSVMSFTNVNVSSKLSYTGTDSTATTLEDVLSSIQSGRTTTLSASENLTFVYRDDYLEVRLGGRTTFANAWYTINKARNTQTWSSSVTGEVNWTAPWGTGIKSDAAYYFYNGYDEGYGDPRTIWNAEISQLLFKKKMTIRFKVYDILNQGKTNSRTTTDNYVQDVVNNTLGRYFMLTLTFRFGNFGEAGKVMESNRPRGPRGGDH